MFVWYGKNVCLCRRINDDPRLHHAEMITRRGHIVKYVKDTKKVALMFGGLDIIYTYRCGLRCHQEDAAERLFPDRMRYGVSRSGVSVHIGVTKQ